jgi:hypothetical protein
MTKDVQEPFMWVCNSLDETEWEASKHKECEHCIPLYTTLPAAQPAPVQEPVAWMYESVCGNDFATRHKPPDYAKNVRPLYTTPPAAQRPWFGLTDEEVAKIVDEQTTDNQGYDIWCDGQGVARAIEAKLKEKNGITEQKGGAA